MKKKIFLIIWLSTLTLIAAKYPPGLRWREISRGHFTIIFPSDRWHQAETALTSAENTYEKLASFWHDQPAGRIRIVLNDSTDDANGFATFFPFNLVGVNLSEPPPDDELAVSGSWLDLVLTHELVHIFTMQSAAEPFRILRRVFGSQPVLYPAVQLPPWVVEGLAVWGESQFTGDGRLNHPPYPLMLDAARRDNLFPGWGPISGTPAAWPGPSAKYLFGAGFMEFLAEKYGPDALRQYLERATSRLVLFSSGRDFAKTFGEPLDKLWGNYRDSVSAASKPDSEPLTQNGFRNQYPCKMGEDRLVYYRRDYRSRGEVVVLNLKSGQDRSLFKMDAVNGLSIAENGKKILLSAADYFHAFNEFSDLFEFDLQLRKIKRLSRGLRLFQPVKRENVNELYCVQHRDSRYFLVLYDADRRLIKTLSSGFAGLSQPSLSPDQHLIAAAVKPDDRPWGIGIFSITGELRAFVTVSGADCRQPHWQNNQTLYFIQAGAETTRLASLSLAGSDGSVCDDPRLNGLQQFTFSGDGENVFFTCFSGRGLEIARLDLAGLPFSSQELIVANRMPEAQAAAPKIISRSYRFWHDLLPHYWASAWRMGGDEFQAGIITGGQDALGINSYSLEGYYGFSSHRANLSFNYSYDGLFPTLSLSYSDKTEYHRSNDLTWREQELKLASLWPLHIRKRSQLYAYADLHVERRANIEDWGTYEIPGSYNGLRLGLSLNSAREYYDSISPTDGVRLIVQGAVHPAGLGNHWSSQNVQADLRHYIPIFRPGVLAWRLALAKSWSSGYPDYDMGGLEGEAGNGLGSNHPFDLLRGFPSGFLYGNRGYLLNLEYRLPLFKIEKAILPAVSLDRIYLVPFFDMGRLWYGSYSNPTTYSIGTEAVLRLAFGGAAVYDFSLGAAYGFGPKKQYWIYLRTGRSF